MCTESGRLFGLSSLPSDAVAPSVWPPEKATTTSEIRNCAFGVTVARVLRLSVYIRATRHEGHCSQQRERERDGRQSAYQLLPPFSFHSLIFAVTESIRYSTKIAYLTAVMSPIFLQLPDNLSVSRRHPTKSAYRVCVSM